MKQVFKIDYQDFMIIITFFLFWISIQFGEVIEDTIAYIFVLSLGIIHGANDLNILQKNKIKKHNFGKSLFIYLMIILFCMLTYWIFPFIAMLAFIILSAYHFGEQHLEKKIADFGILKGIVYTIYGLFIFSLLFHENIADVNIIFSGLTDTEISLPLVQYILISLSVLLLLLPVYAHFKKVSIKFNYFKELLYLFVLFLVFKTGSLIFGFAVYFVFWHSIPSIADQIRFLFGTQNKRSVTKYFKAALFYWILSISGLVIAYYALDSQLFKTVLFLILFAVTAPHTWVMKRMKE
ncbi:beta-carotene 15,15'-dioxygenase [Kordia sp. SMS9]|uniref:Brp/Blh family beta-carotene 15,15'-dioxygenase n=1 Tax=Kordia sp. SMS9 TaxID=2282170 RepID=UPI000E0CD5BF|nr:Brp/Blh family beta-carotene 15,15'-dioxygenase [Kordia sp. SMS9]AXG71902.1 beta-carotene 15,15'-dioxygenase [Kordia sp. SMS9]